MSIAATLLDQARTAGVTLRLAEPGKIKIKGDPEAIAVWAPRLRPHRAELLAMLAEVRPTWQITKGDGSDWVSTFAPAVTLAEVLELYAGATVAPVPDPDQGTDLPPDVAETINGWLDRIGEDDATTRAEALQLAKARPSVRQAYQRMAKPATPQKPNHEAQRPDQQEPHP